MTLGEKIKQLREERKLSQSELARKIGIHSQNIGKYERNESTPSAIILKSIAETFNVSVDSILYNKDNSQQRFVKINDADLIEKMEAVDSMDEKDKQIIKNVIDLAILKYSVKQLQTT